MDRKEGRGNYPYDKPEPAPCHCDVRCHYVMPIDDRQRYSEQLCEEMEQMRSNSFQKRPTPDDPLLKKTVENNVRSGYVASPSCSAQSLLLEPPRLQCDFRLSKWDHSIDLERKHQLLVDAVSEALKEEVLIRDGYPATDLERREIRLPLKKDEITTASCSLTGENYNRSTLRNPIPWHDQKQTQKKKWKSVMEKSCINCQKSNNNCDLSCLEQAIEHSVKKTLGNPKCGTSVRQSSEIGLGNLTSGITNYINKYVKRTISKELKDHVNTNSELMKYGSQPSEADEVCSAHASTCEPESYARQHLDQLPAVEPLFRRSCCKTKPPRRNMCFKT